MIAVAHRLPVRRDEESQLRPESRFRDVKRIFLVRPGNDRTSVLDDGEQSDTVSGSPVEPPDGGVGG